jgi:spore cortex protein
MLTGGGFVLNKAAVTVLSLACAAALSACNANEEAGRQRYNDTTRPIGYYSNEKDMRMADGTDRNGNVILMDDNDGPVTEIMDRTTRDNGAGNGNDLNAREGINRMNTMSQSPTLTYGLQRDGLFYGSARLGAEDDVNYHGHLNSTNARAKTSYYKKHDGDVVQDVVNRVERVKGVDDARALVDGNRLLVAIESDVANPALLEKKVRRELSDVSKSYELHVTVDDGVYSHVRSIDNELRNGGPAGAMRTNFNSLLETVDEKVNRSTR